MVANLDTHRCLSDKADTHGTDSWDSRWGLQGLTVSLSGKCSPGGELATRGEVMSPSWRRVQGDFQITQSVRNCQIRGGVLERWGSGLQPAEDSGVSGTEGGLWVGSPGLGCWLVSPPRAPLLDSRLLPQHQPLPHSHPSGSWALQLE